MRHPIRRVLTLWGIALLLVMGSMPTSAYGADRPVEEPGLQVQAIPDAQGNRVGAKAAIVMEAVTGHILFEQNIDEPLPIASTTKIMTALLTLERPDLDEVFVVNPEAIRVEGSSMGLQEGDQVTLRTLAVGMLLPSGNDAAGAAAVRISGSIPAFVADMNQRAQSLGMGGTVFETPSGLDGENHHSTARDMAVLTRAALVTPGFRDICSQYRMRVSFGNPPYERWLTNHNRLLNAYEGTIGVKTGFTKKAGRCLVSAAERDGVTLIAVTLNCPNDWEVHKSLYDRYFGTITVRDLSETLPPVRVPVTGGTAASVSAVQYAPLEVPVPADGVEIQYKVSAPPFLYAPVSYGQSIGEAEVLVNGASVGKLTLMAGENVPLLHPYVEKKSLWERIAALFQKQTS